MIEIDQSKFKVKPFRYQLDGIKALVRNKYFFLADEMGCGKSAQVINAACLLAAADEIDTVVVVAPASVRSVWIEPEYGEIRKHSWVPLVVYDYHGKMKVIWSTE